jgi:tetratricopeptide (TPR) repeat protein
VKVSTRDCLVRILLGILIASGVTICGAQDKRIKPPYQEQRVQPEGQVFSPLSDEERADLFVARKLYDDAINYYQRALKSSRGSKDNHEIAVLWNKMGIAYQHKMEDREARKAYKKAIHYEKGFADPWNNLGTVYYLQTKAKKSMRYYRHAIELNPNSATFHLNLGTAYFARKKYDQGYQEYRTALALDPDVLTQTSPMGTQVETRHVSAEYYFYLAKLFASMGRAEEAIRYLQRALEDGFSDEKRILEDPDFHKISTEPAFVTLMENPPTPIKE